jgi:hypothetical protein
MLWSCLCKSFDQDVNFNTQVASTSKGDLGHTRASEIAHYFVRQYRRLVNVRERQTKERLDIRVFRTSLDILGPRLGH